METVQTRDIPYALNTEVQERPENGIYMRMQLGMKVPEEMVVIQNLGQGRRYDAFENGN